MHISVGGSSGIVYAYAGEFHNNVNRPKIVSWMATFVAFGNMALPGFAWLILPAQWAFEIPFLGIFFRPWRLLVISYGLPSVLFMLCILYLPESPKFLLNEGRVDEALMALKKMYRVNTRNSEDDFPVSSILLEEETDIKTTKISFLQSVWQQTVPLFKKPLALKTFMMCALQFGVFVS